MPANETPQNPDAPAAAPVLIRQSCARCDSQLFAVYRDPQTRVIRVECLDCRASVLR
jgi:hypothetical protein